MTAADVIRGVARLWWYRGYACLCEVPLRNHRRADLVALGPKGEIALVEVKVSHADLVGDNKWRDYLDYCDEYYWAVPEGRLADTTAAPAFLPERSGLIVADRFEAAILRPATPVPLAAARRKVELLRFARLGALRAMRAGDSCFEGYSGGV